MGKGSAMNPEEHVQAAQAARDALIADLRASVELRLLELVDAVRPVVADAMADQGRLARGVVLLHELRPPLEAEALAAWNREIAELMAAVGAIAPHALVAAAVQRVADELLRAARREREQETETRPAGEAGPGRSGERERIQAA
jgi:hypothetical protein